MMYDSEYGPNQWLEMVVFLSLCEAALDRPRPFA
jgi:hypothetical protein